MIVTKHILAMLLDLHLDSQLSFNFIITGLFLYLFIIISNNYWYVFSCSVLNKMCHMTLSYAFS